MEYPGREPRRGAGSSPEREAEEGSLREDPDHSCTLREADLPALGEDPAPDVRINKAVFRYWEDDRRQGVEGPAWEEVCVSG